MSIRGLRDWWPDGVDPGAVFPCFRLAGPEMAPKHGIPIRGSVVRGRFARPCVEVGERGKRRHREYVPVWMSHAQAMASVAAGNPVDLRHASVQWGARRTQRPGDVAQREERVWLNDHASGELHRMALLSVEPPMAPGNCRIEIMQQDSRVRMIARGVCANSTDRIPMGDDPQSWRFNDAKGLAEHGIFLVDTAGEGPLLVIRRKAPGARRTWTVHSDLSVSWA